MTKEQMLEKTKIIVNAPSCYAELKTAGNDWINSIGKNDENEKYDKYIAMLKDCVSSIDDCLAFSETDMCKQIYGEEGAKQLHENSIKSKEAGVKYCLCDACKNGGEILDSLKQRENVLNL